eukprot:2181407-Amphidinium_carterae.1
MYSCALISPIYAPLSLASLCLYSKLACPSSATPSWFSLLAIWSNDYVRLAARPASHLCGCGGMPQFLVENLIGSAALMEPSCSYGPSRPSSPVHLSACQ